MQGHTQANRMARSDSHSSSFLIRILAIGFLLSSSGLTLLLPSQASAQVAPLASNEQWQAVVYDVTHKHTYTYHAAQTFTVASSMKVPIMLTFLDLVERQKREPTKHENDLLRTMIENSNNDSASEFYYHIIGGAAGVSAYMKRIKITGLYPDPNAWGWSVIYPLTMVQLLTLLDEGKILTKAHRQLALYLMEHVEADQRGGVGDTAPAGATVALKDGWVIAPDGYWAVNSSGIVMTKQDVYVISVYTKGEPSVSAGLNTIRKICRQVAAMLH